MGFLKFLKRDKSKEMDLGLDDMGELDVPPPPPNMSPDMKFGMKAGQFPKFPDMPVKGSPQKESMDLPELPELPKLKEEDFSDIENEPLDMQKGLPEFEGGMPGGYAGMKSKADFRGSMELQEELPPLDDLTPLEEAASEARAERPMEQKMQGMPSFPQQRPLFMQAPRPLFGREPRPIVQEMPKPSFVSKASAYQRAESMAFKEEKSMLGHRRSKGPIFVRVERFRGIIGSASLIKNNLKMAEQTSSKLSEIDESREGAFEKWQSIMLDLQKKFLFIDKTLFKGDKR